jgi:hypothetical protein
MKKSVFTLSEYDVDVVTEFAEDLDRCLRYAENELERLYCDAMIEDRFVKEDLNAMLGVWQMVKMMRQIVDVAFDMRMKYVQGYVVPLERIRFDKERKKEKENAPGPKVRPIPEQKDPRVC